MADISDPLVDKRIVERNIRKGLVSKDDFKNYLEKLPDSEGNAERVKIGTDEPNEGDEG